MTVIDFFLALALVIALFYILRQLERWLHQHIFKVGWLVLKDFHPTTILYYTFLLPGVVLNQLVYWLVAGVFDVRADRAIKMPEKQEVGELKLNFIKLSKKASPAKVSMITLSPFLAGLLFILFAMNNIFQVHIAFADFDGTLDGVFRGIGHITNVPDFWLWAYILFTVANTMMPDFKQIYGIQWIIRLLIVIVVGLLIIGVGDEIINAAINGPLMVILNTLSGAFAFVIVVNGIVVAILAIIENSIEYVTGDSAMFRNGKMIVMTREQVIASRNQDRKRELQAVKEPKQISPLAGAPSIYKLPFPIPSAPGQEPITSVASKIVPPSVSPPSLGSRPTREVPTIITATTDETPETPSFAPVQQPPRPPVRFGGTSAFKDEDEDEDYDDELDEDEDDDSI